MNNILDIVSLKKYYGNNENCVKAIDDLSLNVSSGEYVGIMGASGSGKTTLLNIIATIDSASAGNIILDGTNMLDLSDKELAVIRNEKIGLVFQDYNLLDTLTLYENIALALVFSKIKNDNISKQIYSITEKLGIQNILDKYPYEVSGGQRQRCACARAVVKNPKIILADEPTGALDTKSARELLEVFATMNRKLSSTILMVTHDPVAASYCNRILFLRDGKICNEIYRNNKTKKQFFAKILDINISFGGDLDEI